MLRTLRIGAGLGLALFIVTCTDRSPSGPGRHGASLLDLSALTQAAPGEPAIPMDSVRIVVRGSADQALLLDVTFPLGTLDSSGAADTLSIDVPLRTDPEAVTITVTATGAGVTWYTGTTTASLTNNQTIAPGPLTLTYVGPGAGADSVRIQMAGTRIIGGIARRAAAAVWVPGGILTGVPVGYRVGNASVATVANVGINAVDVTGVVPVRDSTWLYAETPTHLRDSIRVQVVPPATTLVTVSGGGQTGPVGQPLPAPLVVQVRDMLNGGFLGHPVNWTVTAGQATLSAPTSVTDDTGYAFVTVTPTGTAPLTIQASAAGLTGSPLLFTATVGAASGVASTVVTPGLDTLTALTATVALTAQARDTASNPVAGSFGWVSRTPAVATVNGSGLVTAVANGSTWVVATETGGTMDSARIVVQQQVATITVTPGTRSIYLPGTFDFTAAAVDGLGYPVGATAFTWSSTAPAVASVDSTGHVAALGLGTAQIRATAGAIIGVANISVITPITRIVVAVDTVGAASPDTFTLTSLGLSRRYRAIAHDTLDAVMPGVSFTWVSTNGSVAVIDSSTTVLAYVTAAANGVTAIQATAQGFTSAPGAALTVAQVLAAVELNPPANNPTATVAIAGTMGLVARGKDANNRYISGGSFTFASDTPAVATVGATTGLVTGVATGTTNVTASSGAITSNPVVVTVGSGGPAIISFGRDTLSVGRGSSASIPILLSKPSGAAPVTVNLAVADTFAFWSTPSVTIPAGATSANATLNGRNAGTTSVTALDGSGTGYAGDTAVVAVTANMRLTATGYAINATDIVATQVLLSDPSPAGGTYVTFTYGTAGIAGISPDPAFIPAGQLAADIQIRGLAAGTTTITPTAIGVNGTASNFTAYAPVLTPNTSFIRLGTGQYEPNTYIYTPTTTNLSVPVTLTSSDTNVVAVTPLATIPGGSNIAYFTTSAKAAGTATLTLSAPGWTASNTIAVTVTSPLVEICCGATLFTTSPLQNVTVYATDSAGTAHYRTNSLVVRLSSTDSMVLRVLDSVVTIGPGQYFTSAGRVVPGGQGGTASIVATAGGHGTDSALYTVQGPPLAFSWSTNRIGAGQEDYNLYVYTPNSVTSPLVVTLANPDSGVLSAPTAVTIPVGSNIAFFSVRGKATGSVTLAATAAGYQGATAAYIVTTPRVTVCCNATFNNFGPGSGVTVYAADSTGNAHYRSAPLAVSIATTDSSVVVVDSTVVTIDSGAYYNNRARLIPVGVGGPARITFSAAGHLTNDSLAITVQVPQLQLNFNSALIGRRQHYGTNGFYLYTPDNRTSPLAVTITQSNAAADSLSATALTIGAGTNIAFFDAFGLATGTDTLIASAPGYKPDTAVITVTTPRLTNCCMPAGTTTTNPPIGMTVYAADSTGAAHYVMDTLVVAAVTSDTTVIRPTQSSFRILKDAYYANTTVTVGGPGNASVTYSDSAGTGYGPTTTGTITVTGPSLALNTGSTMLGMRQSGGPNSHYVYTPNTVAAPLVVNLVSTDTQVARAPVSVTIPAGNNIAFFDVTAQDTVGTIQIQVSATGYSGASMNVQVTQPRFVLSTAAQLNTTSAPQAITIYAADVNGSAHYTTEAVTVTLLSSSPSVATIDSTTVTMPAGSYYVNTPKWSPGVVGTAQLEASDPRTAQYKYTTGTANVTVVTPALNFNWATQPLGIGQYIDQYVYTPDNAAASISVTLSHTGTPHVSTLVGGTPVSAVTILTGTSLAFIRVTGLSSGTDTLVASTTSPVHTPDTAYTAVGQGLIDPIGNWPSTLPVGDSVLVTLFARDPAGGGRYVLNATTFTLTPNANFEFVSGGASSVVITAATIPADQYYVQFYIKGVSAGGGSATITATNYQPYTNTVTVTP